MYFLSLWWRNMKGIVNKSFSESAYALLVPVHFVTLFLSVAAAGLIKTIYDYSTRTYTDKDKIPPIDNAIMKMGEEQMGYLIDHLKTPSVEYQSNSSARIMTTISNDADKEHEKQGIENMKNALVDRASTTRIQVIMSKNDINKMVDTTNLLQTEKDEIKNTRKRRLDNGLPIYLVNPDGGPFDRIIACKPPIPVKVGLSGSKIDLSNYINNEINNGKQLFQRIVSFFSQQRQNVVSESNLNQTTNTVRMDSV